MTRPTTQDGEAGRGTDPRPKNRGRGHGRWMMIACCIPMLAVAIVLVATGVVGYVFIVVAVGCMLMMAFMMRGMPRGGGSGDP